MNLFVRDLREISGSAAVHGGADSKLSCRSSLSSSVIVAMEELDDTGMSAGCLREGDRSTKLSGDKW